MYGYSILLHTSLACSSTFSPKFEILLFIPITIHPFLHFKNLSNMLRRACRYSGLRRYHAHVAGTRGIHWKYIYYYNHLFISHVNIAHISTAIKLHSIIALSLRTHALPVRLGHFDKGRTSWARRVIVATSRFIRPEAIIVISAIILLSVLSPRKNLSCLTLLALLPQDSWAAELADHGNEDIVMVYNTPIVYVSCSLQRDNNYNLNFYHDNSFNRSMLFWL
jgi:hypothetical protein